MGMSDETATYELDVSPNSVPIVHRNLPCPRCHRRTLTRTHYLDASVAGTRRALMFDRCPCLETGVES